MSDNEVRKVARLAGTAAIAVGGVFGVAADSEVRAQIANADTFRQKLELLRDAVERGDIRAFTIVDGQWKAKQKRDGAVEVAEWQQTWTKDWRKVA
jgi:hypothetical protein